MATRENNARSTRANHAHWNLQRRLWILQLAYLCTATPGWTLDEATKSLALQYYADGKGHYEKGEYLAAAQSFELALKESPLPVLALWAARSYRRGGDLVSAQSLYQEAIRLEPNELWLGEKQQLAQRDAARELEWLSRRPELAAQKKVAAIASTPTKPATIDSTPPRPAAMSSAQRDPPRDAVGTPAADLAPRSNEALPTRTSPWRTVGWISLSAGGAALALGAATGLMLEGRHDQMDAHCAQGICDPGSITQEDVDEYNTLRSVATAGFVAAGLLGAFGLTLILATPPGEPKSAFALQITPSGPILKGAF